MCKKSFEKNFDKSYNHKNVEDKIYEFWEAGGYFNAEVNPQKKPYTIVLPPPNITGTLHMGHALDDTIQDILIRYKRMTGYETLWLPGTDHSAIATEVKVAQKIKDELGKTKQEIGREEFLKIAWEWKEKYGNIIINQLKKIGSSCDWRRERFTMDEGCSKAVMEFFVRLFEKGLIYRGEKMINWCSTCQTTISDIEVDYKEVNANFWHIKCNFTDSSGFLTVATTRPETILADVAVAVHPDDERYKKLVGKTVFIPIINKKIPIIADNFVDKDFGTGVVKVTPAHDPVDYEVGLRHKLPIIHVINKHAIMNENAYKYAGLTVKEAREKIAQDLKNGDMLVKSEAICHNVGHCYRCETGIEPRISKQWFVKMESLAKPAIDCVKNQKTKFVPERFSKIYYHWMENIKDWCISRQIWWGHRIPAWYCDSCDGITVSKVDVKNCKHCGSSKIVQDEDTLDTWFSSALWPFSVLGWPEKTPELKYFFPTQTLVTSYDIIFFWVAKMIFSSLELLDSEPFEHVFIHGLVRDEQGRKMSKSLGNGINPLEIIESHGADALRFALIIGNSPGNDMRFSTQKVTSGSNFANKLWNAARFIHINVGNITKNELPERLIFSSDKWILSRLNKISKKVYDNLYNFELGLALQTLYDFIWDEFCDWYIEFAKVNIQQNAQNSEQTKQILVYVMSEILKLLHPFMPFITEEIWQSFPQKQCSIMVADYPKFDENSTYFEDENLINCVISTTKEIRNKRRELKIPNNKKLEIYINDIKAEENNNIFVNFPQFADILCKLTNSQNVYFSKEPPEKTVNIVTEFVKISISLDNLIDKIEQKVKLEKELSQSQINLMKFEQKLANKSFTKNAPPEIVEQTREMAKSLSVKISAMELELESLKN